LPHVVVQLYSSKKQGQRELAEERLHSADAQQLLRQLVEIYPQTTLVLDALDECDPKTRRSLVNLLDDLVQGAGRPVKVFIASRLDQDIKERFEGGPNVAIRAVDNRDDIARYVGAEIASRPDWTRKVSDSLCEEVVQTLSLKSQGMYVAAAYDPTSPAPLLLFKSLHAHTRQTDRFQWAALQLDQVFELWRESDIRARLGKLPKNLEQTYNELLVTIRSQPGSAPAVAERAFQWVMCAIRPLKADELVSVVWHDPDTNDTLQQVDITIDFVMRACRNLLVLDPQEKTCGFAHLSVQEYFENRVWSVSQSHGLVARTCLSLLIAASREVSRATTPSAIDLRIVESTGLSAATDYSGEQYVVKYWPKHIIKHGEENPDPRSALILKSFLESMDASSMAYQHWQKRLGKYLTCDTFRLAPSTSASFSICYYGFDRLIADWWEYGFEDPSQRNDQGDSLLHLAVMSNSLAVTKRLLDYGLDVNLPNGRGSSPLILAAERADISLIQLLLSTKADVHFQGGYYGYPLSAAAYWGREDMVKLLLHAGADVNYEGGKYGCPLSTAAYSGRSGVVELLLNAGANTNLPGGEYGSPLGAAAIKGRKRVMKLLLDAGADVNHGGGEYGCPLIAAAYSGKKEVVKLLLDAGGDVNHEGGKYGCPLSAAAYSGTKEVVELLLVAGAVVNVDGRVYDAVQQITGAG
jgi:ankyrin repeat protein